MSYMEGIVSQNEFSREYVIVKIHQYSFSPAHIFTEERFPIANF